MATAIASVGSLIILIESLGLARAAHLPGPSSHLLQCPWGWVKQVSVDIGNH